MADFRQVTNNIGPALARLSRQLEPLARDAHNEFVKVTPIRTGNAKRSTDFGQNSIKANYNYANKLNAGYSRQATDGMTEPTIKYLRSRVQRILRG
jgi:hypothetical protein